MKSRRKNIIIVAALLGAAITVPLAGQSPVAYAQAVSINGKAMSGGVQPIKRNGRTLVAMRPIFEGLGATVQWDAAKHSITAKNGDVTVMMNIGSPYAVVDGRMVKLDQAPLLYRGNTMVPLRFVSETMGAAVDYNAKNQRISINTDGKIASSQAAVITLTSDKNVYIPNEPIKLAFTAPANHKYLRVYLVPSDIPSEDPTQNNSNHIGMRNLFTKTQGVFDFNAPPKLGTYEFRSQDKDTQFSSISFEVVAETEDVRHQLSVDKTHYKEKETVLIHYNGVPFQSERLYLISTEIPRGDAEITDANKKARLNMFKSTQGTREYKGIREPGTYEWRMTDGYGNEVAYSKPFTVSGK